MRFLSWLNKKKKYIFAVFALSFILLVSSIYGCFTIPLNKEIISEEIVGRRVNQEGIATAEIIKREIRQNVFVIIGPDGGGKKHLTLLEYKITNGSRANKLSHLNGFWDSSIYEISYPIVPIEGSAKWLAIKKDDISSIRLADNYFIIFDEKKIYHKLLIRNCIRVNAGQFKEGRWIERCAVDYMEGNRKAVIHTSEGDLLLDTVNGVLQKM